MVTGKSVDSSLSNLRLRVPSAKQFDYSDPKVKNILMGQNDNIDYNFSDSIPPLPPRTLKSELNRFTGFGYIFSNGSHHSADLNHLDHIFSRHSYPLAQGPVVLPLDQAQWVNANKTTQEVLAERTEFSHEDSQGCYKWFSSKVGTEAWDDSHTNKGEAYEVVKSDLDIQGAASLIDMSVVYTCSKHQCVVHCPCSVCNDTRDTCKTICKHNPCEDCNPQCTDHELKLPRLFDPSVDHYTMVTDQIDSFRHVVPHAGIPRSCDSCCRDVTEHQIFHMVPHLRCRFCRTEYRPFKMFEVIVDVKTYKKSVMKVNRIDDSTCTFCLVRFKDGYERKNHEKHTHGNQEKKHKCNECGKGYLNKNAFNYHMKKHMNPGKLTCEECGKDFLSEEGLKGHIKKFHSKMDSLDLTFWCEECEKQFFSKSNLNRHMKVTHYDF